VQWLIVRYHYGVYFQPRGNICDCGREKALFDQLNIPCAPYQMVNSEEDLKQAVEAIGLPAILKTATEGYVHIISSPCQRQCEFLSSLGVRRPLTFHILIFSSETPQPNEGMMTSAISL
jgi:hypothetical protein